MFITQMIKCLLEIKLQLRLDPKLVLDTTQLNSGHICSGQLFGT